MRRAVGWVLAALIGCAPPSAGVTFEPPAGESAESSGSSGSSGGPATSTSPGSSPSTTDNSVGTGGSDESSTGGPGPGTGDASSSSGEPILPVAVLDYAFDTSTYNGVYTPANSVAVWIEQDGSWIRTLQLRCDVRCIHLVTYRLASGDDTYDAMTSASDPDHSQTKTGSWDLLDSAAAPVPVDANYELWVEFTEDNSNGNGILGPTFAVPFRLDQGHFTSTDDSQYIYNVNLDGH